jgi:hypothetical protein
MQHRESEGLGGKRKPCTAFALFVRWHWRWPCWLCPPHHRRRSPCPLTSRHPRCPCTSNLLVPPKVLSGHPDIVIGPALSAAYHHGNLVSILCTCLQTNGYMPVLAEVTSAPEARFRRTWRSKMSSASAKFSWCRGAEASGAASVRNRSSTVWEALFGNAPAASRSVAKTTRAGFFSQPARESYHPLSPAYRHPVPPAIVTEGTHQ